MFTRFSLPDGSLTTYDTYPERSLPDGRVRGVIELMQKSTDYYYFLTAIGMVVCHKDSMAERDVSKP